MAQARRTLDILCPSCHANEFELSLMKDEQLGTARCEGCHRDYLLLDSEDYWFDVIQKGYPRLSRCSVCKSTSFRLSFDYAFRDNGDVRAVAVWTTCASCEKRVRRMTIDIDYDGTRALIEEPLRYCSQPKVLYDLKEFTFYVTRDDFAGVVDYLGGNAGATWLAWVSEEQRWVQKSLQRDEVRRLVQSDPGRLRPEKFMQIYCMLKPIAVPESEVATSKQEDRFWKRNEIIRLRAPTHMVLGSNLGLLFYVNFSCEFVDDGKVTRKSREFCALADRFVEWLKAHFVSWRGPNCFDTPQENRRMWGDRFAPVDDRLSDH
jgi:hypothetical protein